MVAQQFASSRITSFDPLGYAAGDTNLYRFVGNSPPNWVDPSGLWGEKPVPLERMCPDPTNPVGAAKSNVALSSIGQFIQGLPEIGGSTTRDMVRRSPDSAVNPRMLPKAPSGYDGANVGGGTHKFVTLPTGPGRYYGTGGAQTCIGIICSTKHHAGIFHFTSMDDAIATLEQYEWPKETKVAIFGGDNTDPSMGTLWDAWKFFFTEGIADIKYHDGDSLWIGANGECVSTPRPPNY